MSATEICGFISGLICVFLVVRQNVWNFPIGIINNIFFIFLFWSSKLYGDMTLQFVYIVLSLIGWYKWTYGGENKTELKVSYVSNIEFLLVLLVSAICNVELQTYLEKVKDPFPLLDAWTTVFSLAAQYLLARKKIENWFLWIVVDILSIGMYWQKRLYLTAVLYLLFLCMCIAGAISWMKAERKQVNGKV